MHLFLQQPIDFWHKKCKNITHKLSTNRLFFVLFLFYFSFFKLSLSSQAKGTKNSSPSPDYFFLFHFRHSILLSRVRLRRSSTRNWISFLDVFQPMFRLLRSTSYTNSTAALEYIIILFVYTFHHPLPRRHLRFPIAHNVKQQPTKKYVCTEKLTRTQDATIITIVFIVWYNNNHRKLFNTNIYVSHK